VLTLSLLLFAPTPSGAQAGRTRRYAVAFRSFGGVRVGMRVAEASKALGVRLTGQDDDPAAEEDCYYAAPERGFKDVSFMVIGGRVVRIDVFGRGYATDRGAKVGDTEERVKRLYKGRVKVSEHPYVDGHYLEVKMEGGRYGIIFETDGKRVTSFRAGNYPAVGYIEGCQ